jgi:PPM family protein phosphatase
MTTMVPDDHLEIDLGVTAAVTDRGRLHRRNEDAVHLEAIAGVGVVAVVCDGVSASHAPNLAARYAAEAAGRALAEALRTGADSMVAESVDALDAAQRAVEKVERPPSRGEDPPACTLVSGVCARGEIVVAWVGDSRAYWVSGGTVRQLTTDNSWAHEQVAAGAMTQRQADADPRAHQITRWVGGDAPPLPPQVVALRPQSAGRLVLCTDGMWGLLSSPDDLVALLDDQSADHGLLAVARHLVDAALAGGGHDNITVAIVDVHVGEEEPR